LDESQELLERAEVSRPDEEEPDDKAKLASRVLDKHESQRVPEPLSPREPNISRYTNTIAKPAREKWYTRLFSRKSRHYESPGPSVTIDAEPQTEAMIDSFLSLTAHDKAATSAHVKYACEVVEEDVSETEHNANVSSTREIKLPQACCLPV
jgi:hypothetical protein